MSQTKEELMTEILQMDNNISHDKNTQSFLQSLNPELVQGFEVKESDVITLTVYMSDNTKPVQTYTDLSVFSKLLVNMITEVGLNIANRELEKTAKEQELKTLLP